MSRTTHELNEEVQRSSQWVQPLFSEVGKVVVGQKLLVERLVMGLLTNGHVLLEGVPGLAKTLTVRTLASCLHTGFQRLQFTPDLLPADLIGTLIYNPRDGEFTTKLGPIFSNLILADEINRTPPKTQAAMLEAMQERQVSAGGKVHKLPAPFFVLATQNPLEQEGTYPLPEAQLDRFLLYIKVDYPSGAEEWEIARRVTSGSLGKVEACLTENEIIEFQKLVMRVPVSDQVLGYAWKLVRSSRPGSADAKDVPDINEYVSWGAGPRGVLALITSAKARAILQGRNHATVGDIQAVAKPCLRHRMACNYAAQAKGLNPEKVIERLLVAIPADRQYEKPAA